MSESMYADLLAAQMEMPALQKSAINPHFGNRFVPLDDLIPAVLPILNKHNLVLVQQPTVADGQPALRTVLLHTSGEVLESTMLLQPTKADPQQQGSAITYARRYALLSWLGLVADEDDDGEAHRVTPPKGQSRPTAFKPATNGHERLPTCPEHGELKFIKAGTSKAGKPYGAFYGCVRDCQAGRNGRGFTVTAVDWEDQLLREAAEPQGEPDYDAVPFE